MLASSFGLQQNAAAALSSRNSSEGFVASEPFNARNCAIPQSLRGVVASTGLVQLP